MFMGSIQDNQVPLITIESLSRVAPSCHNVAAIVNYKIQSLIMSGKRLLDAIQLLSAAKSVAGKHLALRQQQLDVYTRTSSLTKGIKQQVDNLVITAQAASALIGRLDEQKPASSHLDHRPEEQHYINPVVDKRAVIPDSRNQSSIEHANAGTSQRPLSSEEARKLQRQAEFQIPAKQAVAETSPAADNLTVSNAQDTFYSPSLSPEAGLSSLPRVKIPQEGSTVQESDPHVTSRPINSDVFHTAASNSSEVPSEEPSEEVLQALFRSPRVAGSLLSKRKDKPLLSKLQIPAANEQLAPAAEDADVPKQSGPKTEGTAAMKDILQEKNQVFIT